MFEGQFHDGELNGKGRIFLSKMKILFEGNFVNGKKSGHGILKTESQLFKGDFKDDMKHGEFLVYDYLKGVMRHCSY